MARFRIAALVAAFATLMALSLGGRVGAGVPSGDLVFVSSSSSGTVDGVGFTSGDILRWDAATDSWSMFFDGSASGLGAANIDGFHIVDPTDGSEVIELSLAGPISIAGLGIVDDSDVLLFDGGTLTVLFDGSDVGLTSGGEDIDAWTSDGSGPVASTLGAASVPRVGGGTLAATDEDLLDFDGTTGDPTSGAFAQLVDGSDIGFGGDWVAAWVDPTTDEIYGAALNGFNATGLSGDGDDIFVFTGTTGATTSGTLGLYFDGDLHRFGGEQIDGLHVIPGSPPPPGSADLAIAISNDAGAAALAGETVTFTVEVTNNGPDSAMNIVVTDTIAAGLTVTATNGCALDPNGLPCSLGDLSPGQTASFTIGTTVDGTPLGVVTTSVVAASGTADPTPGNNNASSDVLVSGPPVAVDDGPLTNSTPGARFHVAQAGVLAEPAPGLLENDTLGSPIGTIIGFGGGDLGGSSTDYAAGETAPIGVGSLQVNADGSLNFTPDTFQAGPFTFSYRLANDGGFSDAMVTIYVGPRPVVAERDLVYLSTTTNGVVDGIIFEDEDVLVYSTDTDSWEMLFDGSDVGLSAADINGFAIQTLDPDPVLQMTFTAPISIPGIAGTVDDSDVVTFTATSIGSTTAGSFELLIDGSDVGLSSGGEDVDSLTWVPAGGGSDLALSTWGSYNVVGGVAGGDEDLLRFAPTGLGPVTTGVFSQLFDGSDVGLISEDIAGASFDPDSGDIYASTLGPFSVPGLSGDGDDVIVFTGTTGPATAGTFSTFFDGDTVRFGGNQINAVHVILNRNEAPTANPDRAATDENTPISIGPDYTTSIAIPGASEPESVGVDPRNGNIVVADQLNGDTTRIRTYDRVNRRVLHSYTTPTTSFVMGLDVHPASGNVVFITRSTNAITVLDSTLTTVLHTIDPGTVPTSVAFNPLTDEIIVGAVEFTRIYTSDLTSFTNIEHDGLVSGGVDVDERRGLIVTVLWEDQGSFGPGEFIHFFPDGDFVRRFDADQTDFPNDLAIDQATGNVAVTNNTPSGGLIVFNENGNIHAFDDVGIKNASGVAFDPMTGNLLVAEEQGLVLDQAFLGLLDTFLPQPGPALAVAPGDEDIAIGKENQALTTDTFNLFDPTGRARQVMFEESVPDLAIDPTTDRIAVLAGPGRASRRVDIYDPTGTTLLHTTAVSGATAIAFHPDTGELGVAPVSGQFQLWDPTLSTVNQSFPVSGSSVGLGIQPGTGNIVFGDTLGATILDPAGAEIGTIPFAGPGIMRDLAVDPVDGRILLPGTDANVELWDATGTVLLKTIDAGESSDFKPGAFGGTGNIYLGNSGTGDLDVLVRGLLANDTDPDGDPLTVSSFDATSANGAAVTVNPDGSFTYDPTGVAAIAALGAGDTLADTFTYTIDDGNGETSTATATVFVAGVNDAPVLGSPTAIAVNENVAEAADYGATDDSDSESSGLTYSLAGLVDDALFTIDSATGALAFLQAPDFETPRDANLNNVYEIVVKVVDSDGSYHAVPVTVFVLDVTETASITIVQDTRPDWVDDFLFTGDLGAFTLDDDAAAPSNSGDNTFANTFEATLLDPGLYEVTQGLVDLFVLTGLDCVGGSTSVDLGTRTASITVVAGDAVVCTFTAELESDVSITLSDSPDPVEAGGTLQYLFGFGVDGFGVRSPVLTLDLPAGVTYVGSGFSDSFCSETTPGIVTCTFNGLWTGYTDLFEVTVDAGTVGPLTATGSVSFTDSFDPDLSNNSVTISTTVTPGG